MLFVKSTILTLNSKFREFNIGSRRRLGYFKAVITITIRNACQNSSSTNSVKTLGKSYW